MYVSVAAFTKSIEVNTGAVASKMKVADDP